MRFLLTGPVLLTALSAQPGLQTVVPLRSLLTEKEFRDYRARPKYTDRMDLFRKVLEGRTSTVARYVSRDQIEKASTLLGRIEDLSGHVLQETGRARTRKEQRSKQVKKFEISLRKQTERLRDLQSIVPFEYIDGFRDAADELDRVREKLLRQMFGEGISGEGPSDTLPANTSFAMGPGFRAATGIAPSAQSFRSRDRFTEAEFSAIQDNQELVKRVEVLLRIAASRLEEIARRMEKRDWAKEEENPLEFFTYWDMMHAYIRAIDSAMINIDEKAIHELAPEEDLQEALKAVYENMKEFRPRLDPIQGLATDLKDETLFRKVAEARETSLVAYRGALYGLGVPD